MRKKNTLFQRTNLEKIRYARGLSQVQLAEQSGISRRTIAAIEERKVKSIQARTAERLADALNCPAEKVFENFSETKVGYPAGKKRL